MNLTVEPKKQRVQDMQDGNFQLGLTRWGPDYADPMTYLGMWVTGNSNNYGLWSDAEYDSIIEAVSYTHLDVYKRQGALCDDGIVVSIAPQTVVVGVAGHPHTQIGHGVGVVGAPAGQADLKMCIRDRTKNRACLEKMYAKGKQDAEALVRWMQNTKQDESVGT